jgi:nucleotide-binding universal stress UspA family protein
MGRAIGGEHHTVAWEITMYEVRRILVPTDFSRHATDALEHAIAFGHRFHAEITLLHVDEFRVSPLGAGDLLNDDILAYQHFKKAFCEEKFERLAAGLRAKKISVRTRILSGRAYKVIVEESEREEYDLVVLSTRGLTHLSSYLIGSTAERVVRLSRQPVLTAQGPPKQEGIGHSILCPTDFSPAGNSAMAYALSLARQYAVPLYVQYVSELDRPEREEDIRKKIPNLEEHHPHASEVKVEYVFDRDVDPSNSIIRFAEDRDVGLIVMSTHGRKGLRRVYIGNNAAEVVRQSSRPVLTVTHPFHRKIFSSPVTEKTNLTTKEQLP